MEGAHTPLLIVHCKTWSPGTNPVAVEVGLLIDVIVPPPETTLHVPIP